MQARCSGGIVAEREEGGDTAFVEARGSVSTEWRLQFAARL
ncbi:MAG TPA: hypothetical protein VGC35_02195 [Allosphingosinicella sp.]